MNEPRQPEEHPQPEEKVPVNPHAHAPNGVPHDDEAAQSKGLPHSDREQTETAAKP